jgi:DNA-binding response OmpR family regulator
MGNKELSFGNRLSILLVEHDEEVASILGEVLSEEYFVGHAADAAEGLTLLEGYAPDVLLLDPALPRGNAWTVIAKAKRLSAAIIVMSGHSGVLEQFTADGYQTIQKPFKLVQLLDRMRAVEISCLSLRPASVRLESQTVSHA